jgi:hypothetical protein
MLKQMVKPMMRATNPNDTNGTAGRFANQFYRNMACSFIAKRYNLKFKYSYEEEFKQMGIDFFTEGTEFYEGIAYPTEFNFFQFITSNDPMYSPKLCKWNFILHGIYCQTKEFTIYLKEYFNQKEIKNKIISCNPYIERFNFPEGHELVTQQNIKPIGNNDVFVHVRLGDVPQYCPSLQYFDSILSGLKFDKGYISSDTISHSICQALINKYKLIIYNSGEPDTIQFANTCKYIVLSNGTFSWMMAFFGYFSTVYYPKLKFGWHGDIYQFPEWNMRNW